jgi:hypothetical protein
MTKGVGTPAPQANHEEKTPLGTNSPNFTSCCCSMPAARVYAFLNLQNSDSAALLFHCSENSSVLWEYAHRIRPSNKRRR